MDQIISTAPHWHKTPLLRSKWVGHKRLSAYSLKLHIIIIIECS